AARHHHQAFGVVHFHIRAHSQIPAYGLDLSVDHEYVGGVVVHCGDDAPVLDQRGSHVHFLRVLEIIVYTLPAILLPLLQGEGGVRMGSTIVISGLVLLDSWTPSPSCPPP